jgi:hypothetical protein
MSAFLDTMIDQKNQTAQVKTESTVAAKSETSPVTEV